MGGWIGFFRFFVRFVSVFLRFSFSFGREGGRGADPNKHPFVTLIHLFLMRYTPF